jgi:hypothetical protein
MALLGLLMVLEGVFIVRLAKPAFFQVVLDNHIFELVVLLALAQLILLLFRLLDRAPRRICKENECQDLIREAVRHDSRAQSLHVFSSGLGSRLDILTTIHANTTAGFHTEVLAQSPKSHPDREDAKRMPGNLSILKRDHSKAPLEIRCFDTPATIRAMLVCDRSRRPLVGIVSWYRYERTGGGVRVIGRRNPGLVFRADDSAEDTSILAFLMETFENLWKDCEVNLVFKGGGD